MVPANKCIETSNLGLNQQWLFPHVSPPVSKRTDLNPTVIKTSRLCPQQIHHHEHHYSLTRLSRVSLTPSNGLSDRQGSCSRILSFTNSYLGARNTQYSGLEDLVSTLKLQRNAFPWHAVSHRAQQKDDVDAT